MTVLEGQGAPGDIVLAAGEIEMARARVGDSFIAYIACTQENDTQIRHIRELNDLFLNHHIRMRVYDSELDSYQQITLIERAHVDGAKAMIVCPLNFELLEEPLRAAQAAGIPLVFTTSAPDGYGVAVDVDSYELGRMAGQLAGQLVRDEHDGDARVILLGQSDVYAQRLRLVGMLDGLRELAPNARVLGEFGGGTRDNGYAEVERLLEQRQQFEVVLAVNDATAYGAIKALEDADYEPGSVDVISMGGEALARDWVADGRFLRATIDVNREISSQTVFNAAIKMLAGGTLPQTVVIPPGEIITQTG
jgi:ribose transport system substrate-binding protein